jgi:hypothetical protein
MIRLEYDPQSAGVIILDAEYYGEPLTLDARYVKALHEL